MHIATPIHLHLLKAIKMLYLATVSLLTILAIVTYVHVSY